MQVKRLLASAVIAASMGVGVLQAQDMVDVQVPAEFPPASYEGRQYVDSRGCVYVRAGIDGNTSWIPRVSRSRKQICGFKPSLAGQSAKPTQTAAAPKVAPRKIELKAAPKPKAQPAARKRPAAQARVVKRPAQTAKPVQVRKPAPAATAPAPKTVRVIKRTAQAPKPAPKAQPKRAARKVTAPQGQPACQGASAISRQYYRTAPGVSVRCGPQGTPHASVVQSRTARANAMRAPRGAQVVTYQGAQPAPQPVIRQAAPQPRRTVSNPQVRVAPRHVYENQKNSTAGISVPEGYKPAWEDDRLNPKRAHQTFAGMAQMEVAWSNTVPRYLINRETGRDISYMYPGLQYPYTSFEDQRAAGVPVVTRGRVMQPPQRVTASTARRATVSTRSVAPKAKPVERVSKTAPQKNMVRKASLPYVQVGAFRDAGQAQRVAQRLANAGLPTRMGRVTRAGEGYSMVKVGPFRTQPQLERALRKVRGKGYGQARPGN